MVAASLTLLASEFFWARSTEVNTKCSLSSFSLGFMLSGWFHAEPWQPPWRPSSPSSSLIEGQLTNDRKCLVKPLPLLAWALQTQSRHFWKECIHFSQFKISFNLIIPHLRRCIFTAMRTWKSGKLFTRDPMCCLRKRPSGAGMPCYVGGTAPLGHGLQNQFTKLAVVLVVMIGWVIVFHDLILGLNRAG